MEWLTYLLKVTACTVLFLGFYLLVLRKLTFFKINRFYLLAALLLSFVIPVLQISITQETIAIPSVQAKETGNPMPQVLNLQQHRALTEVSATVIQWQDVLWYGYLFIVVVLTSFALSKLYHIVKYLDRADKIWNGLKIIYKTDGFTNCSFFNYIFINRSDFSDEEEQIIVAHEAGHASQYHSFDKILLLFLKAILWFNPVVYLFEKALEEQHEYEVDEYVANQLPVQAYANMLLNMAVKAGKQEKLLVNSFAKNPIKARIKMLFNHKSNKMKKIIYLTIVPVLAVLLWSFSFKYEIPVQVTAKADKLLLVEDANIGKNPIEVINGKEYASSMSPKSVKSSGLSKDKVTLSAVPNKIEYANQQEIENVRKQKGLLDDDIFVRQAKKDNNGKSYELIRIKLTTCSGSVDIPVGGKILFIVDSKKYNEDEFKKLDVEKIRKYKSLSINNGEEVMKEHYDAVIRLNN
ncbi:M56 family metallopeptidase [Pedobacter psychrodurus]|uniref:M56 family metallopeptidase n=1 Tax=Pedobacter psychrodurus TaxID=2530456 RepID=UPI00292ED2A3|nr:M56 family metallopeptidase [Pedobacter psychrodurus]